MTEKHYCKAVNHPKANIRCVSMSDSTKWFCLFWIDESSLLVEYCPFCGMKAASIDNNKSAESPEKTSIALIIGDR